MKIITLTLNPAFDVHCYTENFQAFSENLADVLSNDAGGKGINISRALNKNDIPNIAYVIIGEENGENFIKKLNDDSINYEAYTLDGRIRENITIHTDSQPETRISFSGFNVDNSVIDEMKEKLLKEDLKNTIVTFTGRIPKGTDIEYVKKFLLTLKSKGAKIVIDSRSFTINDIIDVKPWLIKPNEDEIKMYSDIVITDVKAAKEAAIRLKEKGIDNVIISLGGKGAVLSCDNGTFFAKAPEIKVVSTIGAGDSMIAGFLAAVSEGLTYETALKTAVSYGSAACLTEGTKPPRKEEIKKIFCDVIIL